MKRRKFYIKKSHGGIETFSRKKLVTSLQRSGLPKSHCQRIADRVSREVKEGEKTKDIYRKALKLVDQDSPIAAAHYSLKRAIFNLGPAGHHFETFVARYFEKLGHTTTTRRNMMGRLVSHEVDVIAKKNGKRYFVECKFHNRVGIKNDIKVALYVKARWDDLKQGVEGKNLAGFYLASNTAFSQDAITYAKGSGLHLLGVNAPPERSFLEEIKALHLYPITSLKNLKVKIKDQLLENNVVLASELPENVNLLFRLGMQEAQINQLLLEIELLKQSSI